MRPYSPLLKAANNNLKRLADGSIRREEALRRANERREKERKKRERIELFNARRDLKSNIAMWQRERDELQDGFQYLYDAYNNGNIHETEEGMGGLEEVDHMIETLNEKIIAAMDELAGLDWWMR